MRFSLLMCAPQAVAVAVVDRAQVLPGMAVAVVAAARFAAR